MIERRIKGALGILIIVVEICVLSHIV
jgi:hypothetical protein